jgi:hypothetical protein
MAQKLPDSKTASHAGNSVSGQSGSERKRVSFALHNLSICGLPPTTFSPWPTGTNSQQFRVLFQAFFFEGGQPAMSSKLEA